MHGIKNLIFDFDGTLADTSPLILATISATIAAMNLPARSRSECLATIGLRLEETPSALWPEIHNLGPEYAATYQRLFDSLKKSVPVECYPGVIPTLRALRADGYRMAIASSRNRSSLTGYTQEFCIADVFDALVGGDDVTYGKPAPDPVYAICGPLGWQPAETLVIGDAVFDIEMGRNAGCKTCAVTYGNQSAEQLLSSRPDTIINTFPTLLTLLK